jgi:hypothetical protein
MDCCRVIIRMGTNINTYPMSPLVHISSDTLIVKYEINISVPTYHFSNKVAVKGCVALASLYGDIYIYISSFFFTWCCGPTRAMASSFTRFLDHTQRRATVGRTTLGK